MKKELKQLKEVFESIQKEMNTEIKKRLEFQESRLLSAEGKKQEIQKINLKLDALRDKLYKNVSVICEKARKEEQSAEKKDMFAGSFTDETLCKIKFIEQIGKDLSSEEVNNLIINNVDNPVVTRVLAPLAHKYGLAIDEEQFLDSPNEAIAFYDRVMESIKRIVENKLDNVIPVDLAMMWANEE